MIKFIAPSRFVIKLKTTLVVGWKKSRDKPPISLQNSFILAWICLRCTPTIPHIYAPHTLDGVSFYPPEKADGRWSQLVWGCGFPSSAQIWPHANEPAWFPSNAIPLNSLTEASDSISIQFHSFLKFFCQYSRGQLFILVCSVSYFPSWSNPPLI